MPSFRYRQIKIRNQSFTVKDHLRIDFKDFGSIPDKHGLNTNFQIK